MTKLSKIEIFKSSNPVVWSWLEAESANFDFAASLKSSLTRWGALTPRQIAAAEKCAAKRAVKAAEGATVDAEFAALFGDMEIDLTAPNAAPKAPAIKTDKLTEAFDAAKAKGIARPVLRFEGFKANPAPATGKNPGAIYIKADGEYAGKITRDGEFFPARDCPADMRAKIEAAMVDPLAQAVAYGRRTGKCSCCGRELTNGESIDRGIGPICAENFGL